MVSFEPGAAAEPVERPARSVCGWALLFSAEQGAGARTGEPARSDRFHRRFGGVPAVYWQVCLVGFVFGEIWLTW